MFGGAKALTDCHSIPNMVCCVTHVAPKVFSAHIHMVMEILDYMHHATMGICPATLLMKDVFHTIHNFID